MKAIYFLFAISIPLFVGACASKPTYDDTMNQLAKDLEHLHSELFANKDDSSNLRTFTVLLVDGEDGNCSGVVISPTSILTASHCAGLPGLEAVKDGKHFKVESVWVDPVVDIAELKADIGCPCSPIADKTPIRDEAVTIVGYPKYYMLGVQFLTSGRVQGYSPPRNRIAMLAPIAPGVSGGGVFVHQDGIWKLAGVVVEAFRWFPHVSLFAPITNDLRREYLTIKS